MSQSPQICLDSIDRSLGKESLARLPTPVSLQRLHLSSVPREVAIKMDNLTGDVYGGNKVRKLEYILHRAREKHCERIATFGTVGSHHALATALYSKQLGLPCVCFLSHQKMTPNVEESLRMHVQLGTSVVRFGGDYPTRLEILRENLWGRNPWVVPMGGTNWLGAFGFVRAAVELAGQVREGLMPKPDRLYVAAGTMGTAAGLAVGLALAGLPTEVHAVRVSDTSICNEQALARLIDKTVLMMHCLEESVPRELAQQANIRLRHEFFAGGYARTDAGTDAAISFARDELGLELEETYTGKAMAALVHDLEDRTAAAQQFLFWNTYNSTKLPVDPDAPIERDALPAEFLRYVS